MRDRQRPRGKDLPGMFVASPATSRRDRRIPRGARGATSRRPRRQQSAMDMLGMRDGQRGRKHGVCRLQTAEADIKSRRAIPEGKTDPEARLLPQAPPCREPLAVLLLSARHHGQAARRGRPPSRPRAHRLWRPFPFLHTRNRDTATRATEAAHDPPPPASATSCPAD